MVDPSVTARMEGGPADDPPLDRAAMVRATLRPSATPRRPRSPGWPPRCVAVPTGGADRWRELEQRTAYSQPYGNLHPLLVAAETAHLGAMTAGLLVAPVAAAAALVSWSAQPGVVFGGPTVGTSGHLRPPGLAGGSVARLPRAWAENLATVLAGWRATRARMAERRATPLPEPPRASGCPSPAGTPATGAAASRWYPARRG